MVENSEVLKSLRYCQKDSIKIINTHLKSRNEKFLLISLLIGASKAGRICLANHNYK